MTGPEAVAALADSVRISAYDYKIEKWASHSAVASNRYGEFSSVEQTIRIKADHLTQHAAVDTVLHEIGHAIYHVWGMADEDKEERIVGTFATAWTQIHRDNPWLATWISKALA